MDGRMRISGSLRIERRRRGGGGGAAAPAGEAEVVLRLRARNTVVRSGAELVGSLFVGSLFGGTIPTPVNGMAIGTNPEALSAPYELSSLGQTDRAGRTLVGPTAVAISGDDVKVEPLPAEHRVRVSIRGIIPAAAPPPGQPFVPADIAEAALGVLAPAGPPGTPAALAKVYNRVVFDPIPQSQDHELALYWEISFPYGA